MFAKIFNQIFDSSIADDYQLRRFFMELLVLADVNGVVDMTPNAISARTRVPLDEVTRCLAQLEKPDLMSRCPDEQGARIRLLDDHRSWGWEIINYSTYREIASEQQRREKTKQRVRKFRNNQQVTNEVTPCNAPVTLGNDFPSASASASALQEGGAGETIPTLKHALKWLANWKLNGADYTEEETKSAFNALAAGGWMWGRNPIQDPRAALERQIQTDRRNYDNRKTGRTTPQRGVDRNSGTANEGRAEGYDLKKIQANRELRNSKPTSTRKSP